MKHTRRKNFLKSAIMLIALGFTFCACNPDEDDTDFGAGETSVGKGFYVLCEGLWSKNNSALDFYSTETGKTTFDLYLHTNGAGLGETANDILEAEGKLFVAVNGSNCVMVVDKATCKQIRLIALTQGENPQPRCLAYSGGKVYVSCFDGTVYKIDANSYAIERAAATQGRNPEAIAVCENKLFVANTGGLDYPNFDNSISVMNLEDLSLITKIEGLLNPGQIEVYGSQIIVQARGEYDYTTYSYKDSELVRIDAPTLQVVERANVVLNNFTLLNDKVLYTSTDSQMKNYYYSLPIENLSSSPEYFISPTADFTSGLITPYFIDSDPEYVYITDSKDYQTNGECFIVDHDGNLKYRFATSINPKKAIAVQ